MQVYYDVLVVIGYRFHGNSSVTGMCALDAPCKWILKNENKKSVTVVMVTFSVRENNQCRCVNSDCIIAPHLRTSGCRFRTVTCPVVRSRTV